MLRLLVRAARRGRLPAPDPAVTTELQAMHHRLHHGWRDALAEEAAIELRAATAADAFDALEALHKRRSA